MSLPLQVLRFLCPGLASSHNGLSRLIGAVGLAVSVACALGVAGPGATQTIDTTLWVTNGDVSAVAHSGTTLYIGGEFTQVGPATGSAAPISATTGLPAIGFPKVVGPVHVVAPDGSGGWYIGGGFTSVGGIARNNIAHVSSDNRVMDWNPNANDGVYALAVSGSTVYVGGYFASIGGQARNYIAALDATTGLATAWNPNANSYVHALVISGTTIYAGGFFSSIGGQARSNIAALEATTGLATDWNPSANSYVVELAVSGETIYAGGFFTSIGGQARSRLAALDASTGLASGWDPSANNDVTALAVSGATVYAGGTFTNIGGQARSHIAALDGTTGAATAWDPNANADVYVLAVSGSTVYAGGTFTSIGGQARSRLAALDPATGLATAWDPSPNSFVNALCVIGGTVYAGGNFSSIGGQKRNHIAALDITTGVATAWNPNANSRVTALAVSGTTVYAGGGFNTIGGQFRSGLAALNAVTGFATAWNPNASGTVYALAVSGTTVYAGGEFASIGGQPRGRIAALDATTGLATAWNPNANEDVLTLAVSEPTVYAGGLFTSIGGQPRNGIAALGAATGLATAWNPNANNVVHALATSGSTVYAGGQFASIGGQARNGIAAIDSATGLATGWDPSAISGAVYTIAIGGANVYVGGPFSNIGGQLRSGIAALDATTGLATAWNPNAQNPVHALAVSGTTAYAGGAFYSIGGTPQSFIAAIPLTSFTITATAGTSGSISPSGPVWVGSGLGRTFTITPNPGYRVLDVLVDGVSVGAVTQYTFNNVQANHTISATFKDFEARSDFYVANGFVHATALSPAGDVLYIGGDFTQVGPATGGGVPLSTATGIPAPSFPGVVGSVYAVAPDGAGGWYIGGSFTAVGGIPRSNLAHVRADGALGAWNPDASDGVWALAVGGSTVYVGGLFNTIGGLSRNRIAALDATTGIPLGWDPNANGTVWTLAVSGATVYVGGDFTTIGGQTRTRIAALDAATGLPTPWVPSASSTVRALAASGSTIYAGGEFNTIGGQTRNRIAALDAATGLPTAWDPNANNAVWALVVSGSTIHAGGAFTTIGGQPRNRIAALDAATGLSTAWDANANNTVRDLAVSGSTVYVGGEFTTIGGQTRNNLVALDAATGLPTAWNPNANKTVWALAVSDSTVYVGGELTSIGGQTRNRIAALDATTGLPIAWDPGASNGVWALAVSGSTVYAGGYFTNIGGQPRNRVAALDAATGLPTVWDPNANNLILALEVSGSTVYVGGAFTSIGGQARNRIAALDAATGTPTAWNPDASDQVRDLAVSGSTVFVGGDFTAIGGQPRNRLAALDAVTGAPTAWDPNANGTVRALAMNGSAVHAGGNFTNIGGQPRNRLAALDAATGLATPWNPNASDYIEDLAVSGSTIYAAGGFTSIGGQPRNRLAALDAGTGLASAWNPGANNPALSLAVSGSTVYVGGAFASIGGQPQSFIAAIVSTFQTVTASAGANGAMSPSGAVSVPRGQSQLFTITPAAGYRILDVLVDGSSVGPVPQYTFSNVQADHTISATFAPALTGLVTPAALIAADIDGDGKPDLATASATTSALSTLRNISAPRTVLFAPKLDVLPDALPNGLAAVDLDGDGKLDLVTANRPDNTVSINRNTGAPGTLAFASEAHWPVGSNPAALAVGDVDRDGRHDVVVANAGSNSFTVLRNASSPGLPVAVPYNFATGGAPQHVALADLDGDGALDVVTANQGDNTLSVRRNTSAIGSPQFEPRVTFVAASQPAWVAAADMDGDSQPDLVVANRGANSISVFRNIGALGTIAFAPRVDVAVGTAPAALALGDTDGDGRPDVVTANSGAATVSVLRNTSPPGGVSFAPRMDQGVGATPLGVAIADIDGDGKADIATCNSGSGNVSVIRNSSSVTVIASAGPGGEIVPSGTLICADGSEPSFYFRPNQQMKVQDVLVDGVSFPAGSSYTFAALVASHTLEVRFVHDPALASAGWVPNGVSLGQAQDTGDRQSLAPDSAGGAFAVWRDLSSGDLVAQRLNAAGSPQWLSPTTIGYGQNPRVITDEHGGAIVSYVKGTMNGYEATMQRMSGTGALMWNAWGVRLGPSTGASSVAVAADGSGGAVAAWVTDGAAPQTFAQKVASDGLVLWGTAGVALAPTDSAQVLPEVCSDDSGGVIVAWADRRNGELNPDIYAQRVSAGAVLWGPTGTPVCQASGFQWFPHLVAGEDGGAIVTWDDLRAGTGNNDVYAQRVSPEGTPLWSTDGEAVCTATGHQSSQLPVPDGRGGVIVAWMDQRSNEDIYAQRLNASGVPQWQAQGVALTTASGPQIGPAIAEDGNGGAIVAWQDHRVNGVQADIYAQRVSSSGSVLWAADGAPVCVANLAQDNPSVAFDGRGGAFAMWQDFRDPTLCAYAQHIGVAGAAGFDHVISANAIGDGTVTPAGNVGVFAGTSQPFTFSPTGNSRVLDVRVDGVSVGTDSSFTFSGISANHVLDVPFAPNAPVVTAVSPSAGPIGSTVRIHGRSFDTTPGANIVMFGGVRATVTAASSDTQLTVTAPAGAGYEPVTVTVAGLTGASTHHFEVIFTSAGLLDSTSLSRVLTLPVGDQPHFVAAGDVDGDGKLDLVAAKEADDSVSVYRNITTTGTPSFEPGVSLGTLSTPNGISLADLDGDGRLDLIYAQTNSRVLTARRNLSSTGNVSFGSPVDLPTGDETQPHVSAVGDLDLDGRPDLVVNASAPWISVFRSTTQDSIISFAPRLDLITGANSGRVAIGDLDGDGRPEIVLTSLNTDSLSIYPNQSTPGALSFGTRQDYSAGDGTYEIALVDLDGDGRLDVVASSLNTATLHPFRNTSTVGNVSLVAQPAIAVGLDPRRIAASDLDGDGRPDLAVVNHLAHTASVVRNLSSIGSITFTPQTVLATGTGPIGLCAPDLDGDGRPELVSSNIQAASLVVFRNLGSCLISASAGVNGAVLPAGNVAVPGGGSQTFLIQPNERARVLGVTVDGTPQGAITRHTFTNVIASHALSATFVNDTLERAQPFKRMWGSLGTGNGQFLSPVSVAVAPAGDVFVTDSSHRVQRFDANGSFITAWGSQGSGDGQFGGAANLAVDGYGDVYVADNGNDRIQKFTGTGTYLTQWGSSGTGDGQFTSIAGIAVGDDGSVYAADNGNDRIQKFTSTGMFVAAWGMTGSGEGQFADPQGVAVDGLGDVYVADWSNHRVQRFSGNGSFLSQWGSPGTGNGQFDHPGGIAVDLDGHVYVADWGNHRIQEFAPATRYLPITLQPNVAFTFSLGPSSERRAYVVEATPTGASTDGANIQTSVEPLFSGGTWYDVARVLLQGSAVPVPADIRVHSVAPPVAAEFDVVLQPDALQGLTIGSVSSTASYVVEVTPLDNATANARIPSFVQPESNGSEWNDVARFQLLGATGPVKANVRIYAISPPVIGDFNALLQPNVAGGSFLGPIELERGYLVEVSPVELREGGANVKTIVQTEFNGTNWSTVLRLQLLGTSTATNANVKIYATRDTGRYVTRWGTQGAGPGQFDKPGMLADNNSNQVYVVDTNNHRIQHFGFDHRLNIIAGQGGSAAPSGGVGVIDGSSQVITTTPAVGYLLDETYLDGNPAPVDTLVNLASDHEVVVNFEPASYTITATSTANGSVLPYGSLVTGHGLNQTFLIRPNQGARISDVVVNDVSVGGPGLLTLSNIVGARSVVASFEFDPERRDDGWQANGAPICTASDAQDHPSTIPDGNGGAIVAWQDRRSGDSHVYAQRFDASGVPLWGTDGVPVCVVGASNDPPSLLSDGGGGVILVWASWRTTQNDIYAQRVDGAGTPLWAANGVALCTASGHQAAPLLVSDGSGGAIVAWLDGRGADLDIYAQRISAAGSAQWVADGVPVVTAAEAQDRHVMCVDGSGGAIIAWEDKRACATCEWQAFAQRIGADGASLWATDGVPASTLLAGTNMDLAITTDGAGGAFLAWDRGGGSSEVRAQRLTSAGTPNWGSDGVQLSTSGSNVGPSVAADGNGGLVVCWTRRVGAFNDIQGQRLNGQGVELWGTEPPVVCEGPFSTDQTSPMVMMSTEGGYLVAWRDNRSGAPDIYAQRLGQNGAKRWLSDGVPVCTAPGSQLLSGMLDQPGSGALLIWFDGRNGPDNDIYAQTLDSLGTSGFHHTLTITSGPNGTLQPSGTVGVWAGSSHLVAPVPSLGYRVSEIRVDGALVSSASTYTLANITSNHTIEVSFVPGDAAASANAHLVLGHGFQDPLGSPRTREWTAEDLSSKIYAHVSDRWVVNSGGISMGTRALRFGADSVFRPVETASWVFSDGYGNNWSQRLSSPTFSLAANPNARLTLDARVDFRATGSLLDGDRGNEFLGVQGLRTNGTWAFLNVRYTPVGGGLFTDSTVAGKGLLTAEVRLDEDGNQSAGLAATTQLRVVVQTDSSGSHEDGGVMASPGAVIVDNLRLLQGAVDVIPATDFEDNTIGSWTLSAMNGAIRTPGPNASATRDLPAPATLPSLRTGFDTLDPSSVWTFAMTPGDTVPPGTHARIVSPWFALASPGADAVIAFSGKLNTVNQWRSLRPMVRGKNIGDARPRFAATLSGPMNSGTVGADADAPLWVQRELRYPQDFTGGQAADSLQIIFQVEDRAEMAAIQLPRPPTRLPFIDDVRVHQLAVDSDNDGVANALDGCPTLSASGEDADGNGCIDSTATLRHVEMWTVADRPIRFRLSAAGAPGISDDSELAAIRAAFQAWSQISGSSVTIVEEAPTTQTNAAVLDGVNLVTFTDDHAFPANVLAITTTTSFTRRTAFDDRTFLPGQIADADLLLNPDVAFATAVTGSLPGGFDLQSVAMHEVGHFLGLSHSGVQDATMFPVLQPGRDAASLEDDDRAALASAYPSPELELAHASIRGVVTGQGSQPMAGVLVIAVRLDGGGVPVDSTASDFTREDGSYALYRLPPARYAVRITPLDGSVPGLVPGAINSRVEAIARTDFPAEWWSTVENDSDNVELKTAIPLVAGQQRTGVNLVTNTDVTPPTVISVAPGNQAEGIPVDAPVLLAFSEAIENETFEAAFSLRPTSGDTTSLGGRGRVINAGRLVVFTPDGLLEHDTEYRVRITTALTDRAGVHLATPYATLFRTQVTPTLATTAVIPAQAPVGAVVTIQGVGFDAATLANNAARFTCGGCPDVPALSVTPTSMTVVVPPQAVSDPVWAVVDGEVSATSAAFGVLPPGSQLAPTPSGSPVSLTFEPFDLAMAADGGTVVVVGDGGLATVRLVPGPDFRVPVPLTIGRATHVTMRPDRLEAFISQPDSGRILVMNADPSGAFRSLTDTIFVSGAPGAITFRPDGRRAFVADTEEGVIHELATSLPGSSPNGVVREWVLPDTLLTGGIAVDATGGALYFTTLNAGLQRLDLATGTRVAIGGEGGAGSMVSPDNREALFPTASGLIAVRGWLGAGTTPVTSAIPLPGNARDLAVGAQSRVAYVVNSLFNRLQVVDMDSTRATYRSVVGSVATGSAPVAVATSAGGAVIAVANAAARSVALYDLLGGGGLVRVTPDIAVPGELAAVLSGGGSFVTGTQVDVAEVVSPVHEALGVGATFRVPITYQRATTVTLVDSGTVKERTLALPFRIVDPIVPVTPRATSIVRTAPRVACISDSGHTPLRAIHASPDGNVMAAVMGAEVVGSCQAPPAIMFWQASESGLGVMGGWLTTRTLLVDDILDAAFTPDGQRLWVATEVGGNHAIQVLDADPSSAGFGGVIEVLSSPALGAVSKLVTDPLGRWMIAAAALDQNAKLVSATGAVLDTFNLAPHTPLSMALARDGRHLVVGAEDRALFYDVVNGTRVATSAAHPGTPLSSIALTRDGRRAVGRAGGNQLEVWRLESPVGQAIGSLTTTPGNIGALIPGPAAATVLATCVDCPSLFELDASGPSPSLTTTSLGRPGIAAAASSDGRRIWVGTSGAATEPDTLVVYGLSPVARADLVSGQGQLASPGADLPLSVRVQLVDTFGRPQQGSVVRFALAGSGEGVLDDRPGLATLYKITDVGGEAAVSWQMPTSMGTADLLVQGEGLASSIGVTAQVVASDALAAPTVLELVPVDGQSGIRVSSPVLVRFSQAMDSSSVALRTTLTANGNLIEGSYGLVDEGRTLRFQGSQPLPFDANCELTVAAGAVDAEGQILASEASTEFTSETQPPLSVAGVDPPAAPPGALVVISGTGFSPVANQNTVLFGDLIAPVTSGSDRALVVEVPHGAATGDLKVGNGGSFSNVILFEVLEPGVEPGLPADPIAVPVGCRDLAVTPDSDRAYVTNPYANSVAAVDLESQLNIAIIPVGYRPVAIEIMPWTELAYVANAGSHDVSVIDTDPLSADYNRVVATIPVGRHPVDLAISASGSSIIVITAGDSMLNVIDGEPTNATFHRVVKKIKLGSGGSQVVVAAEGTFAYVATSTGVDIVDLVRHEVVQKVKLGSGGSQVAVSADGTLLFVLTGGDVLTVIDIAPGSATFNQVVKKTKLGSGGSQVMVSPEGTLLFVTMADRNEVQVFQIITTSTTPGAVVQPAGAVVDLVPVATIPVGMVPNGLAADPHGGFAVVANEGSGSLTIIPLQAGSLLPMEMDFILDRFRLAPFEPYATVYLEPPPPHTPAQIQQGSVRLGGVIPVGKAGITGDRDGDLIPDLSLGFLRMATLAALPIGPAVTVTATGLVDTLPFIARDTLNVRRGEILWPVAGTRVHTGSQAFVLYDQTRDSSAISIAVLHTSGSGEQWVLDASGLPHTGGVPWTAPASALDSVRVAIVMVDQVHGDGTVTGVIGVSDYFTVGTALDVSPGKAVLELAPVSPNPAQGTVNVRFSLSRPGQATLEVMDVQGRRVRELARGEREAGAHVLTWRGVNARGSATGAGVYFVRLRAEGRELVRRFIWMP